MAVFRVREMFYHAFDGYMQHAFPLDELKPLTCMGEDTLGGYALTLVDSLDTMALLGDRERFATAVEWIGKNLRFDICLSTLYVMLELQFTNASTEVWDKA
ncbi:Alpha-mannosidase I mns4 [Asimina triloba]